MVAPTASRVVAVTLALLALGAARDAASARAQQTPRAEILWDTYGIPHIRATDDAALFFAFGWAQARNHGNLLLRLLGVSRARAAEYWGEDELGSDRLLWTLRIPDAAERAYASYDPTFRSYIDAFAAGINAYADAHPDRIAQEVRRVLPIRGVDILAHAGVIGLGFSRAPSVVEQWARQAATSPGQESALAAEAAAAPGAGSNAWAIAPAKSASGRALLLANPHLPWGGIMTWMEAQLTSPSIDIYGATLVGMPVIAIGFNDRLGWTHTVNTQDTEDFYELQMSGPSSYAFAGAERELAVDTVLIGVRRAGAVEREPLVRLRSVHGPVLGVADGRALAARRLEDVGEARLSDAFPQWWDMGRARDRRAFEQALRRHAIVGQNITYADAAGDIAYYYGAATPVRPGGDAAFWAWFLPGDSAALVWTEVHPFDDMPRVVNPPAGWVQNANDPPWLATYPRALDRDAFPAYFAPDILPLRPQRSIRMLRQAGTLSLEGLIARKHSTYMELADRVLPELVAAARAHGGPAARRAAAVLIGWDRTANPQSRGGVLFQAWALAAFRRTGNQPFATRWSAAAPLTTP
ncbi:MAG: penicillin acylase family protein, partial [Longimicrobiales bacterium]